MMTAAVIGLTVAVVGMVGVLVWLVRRGDVRVDEALDARRELDRAKDDLRAQTIKAERADFERTKAIEALESERRRADALEEFIADDAQETAPDAVLAPDDVAGRLLRFSRSATGRSVRTGGTIGVGTDPAVRP